ncbi:MAG TPA: polyphosphate--AMP phosphotransferase [Slackia equolifaciens]|uniref:Polyphosphate--AMP phosphotransferase n=1 Tax=Slackia equolifaciens TaxID=498718 RepID=A0A9D2UWV9_9ACTN|nr:polyphosphate--AMP phosphotransferase [Slackia equolifaciens]
MLEQVDLSVKTPKEEYKPAYDALLSKLVVLQQKARSEGLGLVVLFEGWKGAGKGSRIGDLLHNLDARATHVHVLSNFDEEEAKRFRDMGTGVTGFQPFMQEFWDSLGMRGEMTIYERGWYTAAARRLLYTDKEDLTQTYRAAAGEFERQLAADGYVIVKFFVHVSKEAQKKRLRELRSNPSTAWRVTDRDLKHLKDYDETYERYDELLRMTDYDFARWTIVNGEDKRTANLVIAQTIVNAMERALEKGADPAAAAAALKAQQNSAGLLAATDPRNRSEEETARVMEEAKRQAEEAAALAPRHSRFTMVKHPPRLEDIDYSLALTREEYREELKREQKRLGELELEMYLARVPLMLVYEGDDAAGKGGSIKRVAQAIDARAYTIFPSPAPTKPELMHPHLWRYWTRLPRAGHVGIYDRSWYGRVLVERVEGFASPEEWGRAYDEINEFEQELNAWGALLIKFWVAVDRDEQLRRFTERENTPEKQWKITSEDWRNRDKAPQYASAINDMFRLTSTEYAPWTILESSNKYYARIKALKTINDALEKRLGK